MAKIILNVTTNIKSAQEGVSNLKKVVDSLAKSFKNVKADKELTEQIKVLTEWNKSLAAAVERTTKTNYQSEISEEKLATARAKTATQTAKQQIEEQKLQREVAKTAKATEDAAKKAKTLVDALRSWSVTSSLLRSAINLTKSTISDMNETLADTEKRIIAIQRVLPEGSVGDQDLANKLYDLAIEYGQTFQNVSDIATDFARTGLSYADTIEATRSALLALNVAELDSTQATEGMIAIMAQFSLSADQMNDVVDKLNKTADRFPVTTQKLLTALQRMGSSASIAGLSLDESIGIATALSKATGRSGANVGTAANALIQYSTKEKALNTYAALSPEVAAIVEQYKIGAANVLQIWEALSKEINNLTAEQSEKLDVLAEYFETGEGAGLKSELEAELGDVFNDISGVFSTANTFRKNYFVALLQNMDTVAEATETARDAQGYSIKENEKEMQTYEKRVQALQSQWEKLANDEQGWLEFRKGLVELGSLLLKILEWTGGLRTAFILLGTALTLVYGQKVLTEFMGVINSIRSLTTATREATAAATTLSTAWQGVFAIVGLAASVISIITGAVEQYKQSQHEANLETISAWEAKKEDITKLQTLYQKYKELTPESSEYKTIESQIVALLGEKASLLKGITADTDNYRESIEKLTESEIENARVSAARAASAALMEFKEGDQTNLVNGINSIFAATRNNAWATDEYYYDSTTGTNHINAILRSLGFNLTNDWESGTTKLADIKNKKDLQSQINDYIVYHEALQKLEEYAQNADVGLKGYIYGSTAYSEISNGAEAGSTLETAIKKAIESVTFGENPQSAEDVESLRDKTNKYLATMFGFDFSSNDYLKSKIAAWFNEYISYVDDASEDTNKTHLTYLQKIKDKYSEIKDAIKGITDAEKEATKETEKQLAIAEAQKKLDEAIAKAKADYVKNAFEEYIDGLSFENEKSEKQQSIDEARLKVSEAELEVEEKRQAVKEAEYNLQKAQADLEYARNNRSERVFNSETGMWEYQANQKNVQSAQEKVRQATEKVADATKDVEKAVNDVEKAEQNVQKAVVNLQSYLQNKAVAEIKKAIEDGNTDASDIDTILNKWFGNGGGTWGEGVKNAIATAVASASGAIGGDSNVVKARANLQSAQDALRDLYQDRFYNEVANILDEETLPTETEVARIIEKYKNLVSEEAIQAVLDVYREAGVNIPRSREPLRGKVSYDQTYDNYTPHAYDSGGVLGGMGGIKATSEPEIVIDPELSKRILNPVSTEAFSKFASTLGIIFGTPLKNGLLKSSYTNNWHNSSTDDHRSYNINGVPISQQAAQKYTIAELFENMDLV